MKRLVVAALMLATSCTPERVVNPLGRMPRDDHPVTRDVSGGTAPGGMVHGRDGTQVDLASLWEKQPVVIVFYMGHWCPHCQRQLGDLEEHGKDFDALGAKIVAISTDSIDDAAALHEHLGLHFDLYSDPELTVIQKWGVEDFSAGIARPATFIVEPGGNIKFRHIGQNQTDRPTTSEVLAALRSTGEPAEPSAEPSE